MRRLCHGFTLSLGVGLLALWQLPILAQAASKDGRLLLERSWQQLDQQLRLLDALIPADPQAPPEAMVPTTALPQSLLQPNGPATAPLNPQDAIAPAPLNLPTPQQLQQGQIQGVSLEQALAIAFRNNPQLQAQRLLVAAQLAELQAALGSYWPRISALANASTDQAATLYVAPVGTNRLNLGPLFSPASNGLKAVNGSNSAGPFYVSDGGAAALNSANNTALAGLELDYALIDFARNPTVQAARALLNSARNSYASQLRLLQLQVSEAYYQLQQADQNVRIQDAAVRNDLLILQDALYLKQAGLVPRLDVLRRRSIEASDQEALIQAMADRAIARRQLAVLLNLPTELTPSASDPITPMPRWPLNLESSLLAAYRGNPELEAILATREALARQRDAVAAALLPKLSLFAQGNGNTSNSTTFNVNAFRGACCATPIVPEQNTSGTDWSVGLSLRWLLFDAGTTAGQARALERRAEASAQQYAAQRNAIRLRMETAFFNHEASLARLAAARRGAAAALEAFRDVKLRYQTGLSSEVDLSITQERLISSLVQRLNATVGVNISYARLLRELLPVPTDPAAPITPQLIFGATPPGDAAPAGLGQPQQGLQP